MMFFLWIPFLIVALIFGSMAFRGGVPAACMAGHATGATTSDSASEILRRRLALGEITPAQYQEMRRTLGI